MHCEAQTGKPLDFRTLSMPDLNQPGRVGGSREGLLLGAKNALVAIPVRGELLPLSDHSEGLWVNSGRLVTGQKVSAEEYRLSGVELPGGGSLWQVILGYSTLLGVEQGVVYVATPSGVMAINCESGQTLWTNPAVIGVNAHFLSRQALLVSAANSGVVHWLDLANGKSLRQVKTNDENMRILVLASDGETTLVVTRRVAVSGYGPKSDQPLWSLPLSSEEHDSELVAYQDGIVLVPLENETQAIELKTGKRLWKGPLSLGVVAVSQGVALLTLARAELGESSLEARELASGKKLWSRVCQGKSTGVSGVDQGFLIVSPSIQEAVGF